MMWANTKIESLRPLIHSAVTRPYREGSITENGIKTTYYYLCKGERTLTKGKDDAKLQQYVEEFNKLVKDYAERSL